MSISKLEVALRLVSDEEKQAALMFKSVQDDFVSAEHALNQALAYRVEYEALSRGIRPSKFALLQLRAARSFLTNIDSLIDNQRGILRAKYEVLEAKREQWQLLRAKRKSIKALISAKSNARTIANAKREQTRLDDLFGRRSLN